LLLCVVAAIKEYPARKVVRTAGGSDIERSPQLIPRLRSRIIANAAFALRRSQVQSRQKPVRHREKHNMAAAHHRAGQAWPALVCDRVSIHRAKRNPHFQHHLLRCIRLHGQPLGEPLHPLSLHFFFCSSCSLLTQPNPPQVLTVEVNSAQQQQQDSEQIKKSSWSSIRSAVVKSASIAPAARAQLPLPSHETFSAGPANTRYLFAFPSKTDLDKWLKLLTQSRTAHPLEPSRGKLLSTLSPPPTLTKSTMSLAVDVSTADNSPAITYVGSMLWMLGRCAALSCG